MAWGAWTDRARLCVRADHAEKLHVLPEESLADGMPVVKKIVLAVGAVDYNVLQVWVVRAPGCAVADLAAEKRAECAPGMYPPCVVHRSSLRGQEVDQVHFHVILKQSENEGTAMSSPQQPAEMEQLKKVHSVISGRL